MATRSPGGFPQQGGQPHSDQQYGQPSGYDQGGYPPTSQFGQPGGFGGPPPPKKGKAGMWIAIGAVVVLVLGALGITGFVAPGFFLSDDNSSNNNAAAGGTPTPVPASSSKSSAPSSSKPSSSSSTRTSGPAVDDTAAKTAAQGFIQKVNGGDSAGATTFVCQETSASSNPRSTGRPRAARTSPPR